MGALHVFDMDGTLLRSTTASVEISRRLGRLDELTDLERRFATGEITAPGFALEVRDLWADLDPDLVADVAAGAPWIGAITEVCADIAARGETSMLVTLSPDFFARHLHGFGVEVVHASRFPPLPFTAPVDPGAILTPADKVRLTEAERTARGLSLRACVAYGDSMSDKPLFAHLRNTVAVNADPALEALARVAYRGDDLREAYVHGRSLLDEQITVTRLVDAAPGGVFAVLRDPRRHPELDGSDTLRAAPDASPVTGVGDAFVMQLQAPDLGTYRSRSFVVEYEPDHIIAWSPGPVDEQPFGHLYRYTLEPDGPHRTRVTQTYDWSRVTDPRLTDQLPRVSRDELARTLDLLAAVVEVGRP